MKSRRNSLSQDDCKINSKKIKDNLFLFLENIKYNSVCIYISAFKEPYTIDIIKKLLQNKTQVCVPITDIKTKTISLSLINDINFKKGAYNICEPVINIPVSYDFPDIIIVPGIAFDKSKNRIGFGMGYYDKFLSFSKGIKVGLCHDFQIIDNIPAKSHDIKMDTIITEKRIYK